ncbi:centrosomal protein 20-like [Ylistrum balloti]|uniref:centrosomal protein 20-like n=1 Tax=Ylistrum balloti TaxID=509963 RepID=UPI002905CC67|nr:centrosomal protein 20-like [Ylistrum balloti]
MTSTQELKDVIKETLESHGTLGQIKARIRAEVFNSLDDHGETKPQLSSENMIINELIREYLEFNKYKYSSSVLTAESGQPKEPLNREFLARELNIREDHTSSSIPMLYSIVSHYIKDNRSVLARSTVRDRSSAPQIGSAFRDQDEETEKGILVRGGAR